MSQKTLIYIALSIGSIIGGWLGGLFDHGNWLGGWSLLGGTLGAFLGIWAGYRLGKNL